jgi:molybdate transport system substrate-binding protein
MKIQRFSKIGICLAILLAFTACASPTPISVPVVTDPSAAATLIPAMPMAVPRNLPATASPTQRPASIATQPPAITLNIFAAASLTDAFEEIGKAFEADHPGVTVSNNYAGSQQLAQQINQGAPADVFASANTVQMTTVITTGQVISGRQQTFARNRLVVVVPQANPGKIAQLQDLANPGLTLVLADKVVPVGNYALTFLDKASKDPAFGAGYKANVLKNVVSYENDVKAVLAKVQLGEADAGIVYTTDAASAGTAKVSQLAIPDSLNVIAVYPIAPVKSSPNPETAQAYIDFVLSPSGQAILAKYGFIVN